MHTLLRRCFDFNSYNILTSAIATPGHTTYSIGGSASALTCSTQRSLRLWLSISFTAVRRKSEVWGFLLRWLWASREPCYYSLGYITSGNFRLTGKLVVHPHWSDSWLIRTHSLERINDYLVIEHERPDTPSREPPAHWPTSGDLKLENVSVRYAAVRPRPASEIMTLTRMYMAEGCA